MANKRKGGFDGQVQAGKKMRKKNPDFWWGGVGWGREDDGWVGLG